MLLAGEARGSVFCSLRGFLDRENGTVSTDLQSCTFLIGTMTQFQLVCRAARSIRDNDSFNWCAELHVPDGDNGTVSTGVQSRVTGL